MQPRALSSEAETKTGNGSPGDGHVVWSHGSGSGGQMQRRQESKASREHELRGLPAMAVVASSHTSPVPALRMEGVGAASLSLGGAQGTQTERGTRATISGGFGGLLRDEEGAALGSGGIGSFTAREGTESGAGSNKE